MFVMRAAVGVEANPWTGGKVALAHKEFSNTAEVSRKVREDSILREILSRGLPSVCCYRYFPSGPEHSANRQVHGDQPGTVRKVVAVKTT